ncbi:hypothetical protein AC249_AIPGENE24330 [Exaiptasia diaphana]|nr:hypothetical protein AC249_AIPGENE24330 [Exaiptasia diaphana]
MALYNTFLQYLNDLQKGNIVNVESMALNPPLAHFIGHKLHSSLLEKCLLKMLPTLIKIKNMLVKPAQNVYLATFPPPILQDPSIVKRTSVIPAVLRKDELSQLLMLGKKHGCTFHSVITAATRLAMAQILNTGSVKSIPDMMNFINAFTISLRNDTQPPTPKGVFAGAFFSGVSLDVPTPCIQSVTPQAFWDFAKECHTLIREVVQKDRFQFIKILSNVDVKEMMSTLEHPTNYGRSEEAFNISNIGRFVIGEPTDVFQFGGTYFATAEQTIGPPFNHSVVFLAIDKTNSPDAFDFEPSVCEDGKLQRPLGMFEKTCQFLSALNDGSGNDITVLIVKSRVSLNPDMVKRALVLVQERYPLLRMRVHGLTSKFKEMKDHFKVDFKTMNYYDPQEWVQAFEEESLIPFDLDQGPLWRVSMLKEHFDGHHYENSLLFSFHHIICDGTSIMALYNTFLQYLNDLQNNNDVDVESMALNPPLAHFIGHKLHSSLLEKCLFKMLPTLIKIKNMLVKPAQNISLATFPPPILQDPSIVKRTSVIPAVLRKDELSQLLMLGKKHGCTFHSVITAATRLAMAQILNTGSVKSKSDMVSFINGFNISLRNDAQPPIPKEEFGLFISVLQMNVPTPAVQKITPQDFRDFARECQCINKEISSE